MSRPVCALCGQTIDYGVLYTKPTKDTFQHEPCPKPTALDRLGQILWRYVAPALMLGLLLWPGDVPNLYVVSYRMEVTLDPGAAQTLPPCGRGIEPTIETACWILLDEGHDMLAVQRS